MLDSTTSSTSERISAGATIILAPILEGIEPDDVSPIGLPADDLGRKAILKGINEAWDSGGADAVYRLFKNTFPNKADEAFIELTNLVTSKMEFRVYEAKQLEKKFGIKKGGYHATDGVKNTILKDLNSNDSPYKSLMKQIGRNPNIAVAKDGTIQIVSTAHRGKSFNTLYNIKEYI